jgi:hypothetical protein
MSLGYVPDIGPKSKVCVVHQCHNLGAIYCWIVSGDADSMGATWNPFCAEHAGIQMARLTRELVAGGPCKSLMVVLP